MRAVVLQSNYVPWKGYFDLVAASDIFIVYDSVQFTKNDWRNRNRLRGAEDQVWLTIPVATAGRLAQSIDTVRVANSRWPIKHWRTVRQLLGREQYFGSLEDDWAGWFAQAEDMELLHDINWLFLEGICRQLGITTPMLSDRALPVFEGSSTQRLVQICDHLGASSYLTGPAGLDYLEIAQFQRAGVDVEVYDYSGYRPYAGAKGEFSHRVSVLDLLACCGPEAERYMLGESGIRRLT